MTRICKFLCDIVFPNRCPCCFKVIKWDSLMCNECIENLPIVEDEICDGCGKVNCICTSKKQYEKCISITYYEGIIRKGIINLKLKNATNFAEYFAIEIIGKLQEKNLLDSIDVVSCVPMNKAKQIKRGYNQAEILGKIIARLIKKPFNPNILIKTDKNLTQHNLSYSKRKKYVKNAFKSNNVNIQGFNVLICDDIITTGSTINECSRLLKQMGAKSVYACTIATTNKKY